jgi:hypothetical protein
MKSVDSLLNRRRMRIAFQCILAAFILLPARSLPLETVQEVEARWVEMKKNFGYRPKTLELLTFTPSVDTAERDLPMHGGSNP